MKNLKPVPVPADINCHVANQIDEFLGSNSPLDRDIGIWNLKTVQIVYGHSTEHMLEEYNRWKKNAIRRGVIVKSLRSSGNLDRAWVKVQDIETGEEFDSGVSLDKSGFGPYVSYRKMSKGFEYPIFNRHGEVFPGDAHYVAVTNRYLIIGDKSFEFREFLELERMRTELKLMDARAQKELAEIAKLLNEMRKDKGKGQFEEE